MAWKFFNSSGQEIVSDTVADGSITFAKMAANSINSDQYVDGSIDNAHLADDAVDSDELAAGSVDIAHLAASGSASSSTFLRGDNAWAATGAPTEATKTNMAGEATGTIYVPPDLVKNSPGVAKAWVNFAIDTTIDSDYNVTDVTDNAVGSWTINFTDNFATTTYTVTLGLEDDSQHKFLQIGPGGRAAGTLLVQIRDASGNLVDIGATDSIAVACYGTLA